MPQRHPENTCLKWNPGPAMMAHAYNLSTPKAVVRDLWWFKGQNGLPSKLQFSLGYKDHLKHCTEKEDWTTVSSIFTFYPCVLPQEMGNYKSRMESTRGPLGLQCAMPWTDSFAWTLGLWQERLFLKVMNPFRRWSLARGCGSLALRFDSQVPLPASLSAMCPATVGVWSGAANVIKGYILYLKTWLPQDQQIPLYSSPCWLNLAPQFKIIG